MSFNPKKEKGIISGVIAPRKEYAVERKTARFRRLDKLRDIAALMVVLSHIPAMILNPALGDDIQSIWMKILWSLGAPAVDIFLVLSGYVVALSWMRQQVRGGNASGFYAGRMLRLMPIYLISFGLALICWSLMQTIGNPVGSSMKLAMSQPTISGVISNIVPIWPTQTTRILNPPWWTLQVELMAMIVIPPLVSVMLNKGIKIGLAWIIMVTIVQGILVLIDLFEAAQYICLIGVILGAMIAVARNNPDGLIKKTDRLFSKKKSKNIIYIFIFAIMASSQFLQEIGIRYEITRTIGAIGAATLIIFLTNRRRYVKYKYTKTNIKHGEISYPLYAIHYPLMMLGASLVSIKSTSPYDIMLGGLVGAMVAYVLSLWLAVTIEKASVYRSSRFMEKRLMPDELRKN